MATTKDRVEQTLRKPIREYLRKRGEPMSQVVSLQDRGDDVRLSLMKAAYEEYDDVPDKVEQWYDPEQNVVVIPLPESEKEENGQSLLSEHTGNRQENRPE